MMLNIFKTKESLFNFFGLVQIRFTKIFLSDFDILLAINISSIQDSYSIYNPHESFIAKEIKFSAFFDLDLHFLLDQFGLNIF